ncbi:hypothetical protein Syun_018410 [Stephania yunnanensis]|uniref:Secreted protein n=1 Tax=Stephania yunnanensis TaxID=152371 RepID=A0AAP0IS64_9MAGN
MLKFILLLVLLFQQSDLLELKFSCEDPVFLFGSSFFGLFRFYSSSGCIGCFLLQAMDGFVFLVLLKMHVVVD